MALNSWFLEALLGHLWSVPTPPTVPFPSWSSLWLESQLGPTLAMLSKNSFLNYCPGDLKYSLSLVVTSLHVFSSSELLDCKPNLLLENGGCLHKKSQPPSSLAYVHLNLLVNDEMLWLMTVAWLTFRSCRSNQTLFLAPVWLIRDKLQQCRIVLLTPTHAIPGQWHSHWKESLHIHIPENLFV